VKRKLAFPLGCPFQTGNSGKKRREKKKAGSRPWKEKKGDFGVGEKLRFILKKVLRKPNPLSTPKIRMRDSESKKSILVLIWQEEHWDIKKKEGKKQRSLRYDSKNDKSKRGGRGRVGERKKKSLRRLSKGKNRPERGEKGLVKKVN